MSEVKYYLNEARNQILVSGSSTKGGMNALLTSSKNPNTNFDQNFTAKISSLGMSTTYVVQNGTDNTSINIEDNQELWVYRGYNQSGGTDGLTYRYNPHLHRPYKAYILTETGSGSPGFPYSPTGSFINTSLQNSSGADIPNKYIERQLAVIGNENSNITSSAASGSFKVYDDARSVHPFVFTKYHTLVSPPGLGALFVIYKEDASTTFTGQEFNTSTSAGNPGQDKISFNNATPASITKVRVDSSLATGQILGALSSSIADNGKSGGVFRVMGDPTNTNYVEFNVDAIDNLGVVPLNYYELSVSNPVESTGFTLFGNNDPISSSLDNYSQNIGSLIQQQGFGGQNSTPSTYDSFNLRIGEYTYTSSTFTQNDTIGNPASGSTQFGLYTDYDFYVSYQAQNQSLDTVRIFFTGSQGVLDSQFFDLPTQMQATFRGLVGSTSASSATFSSNRSITGEYQGINFDMTIVNPTVPGVTPQDIFATRWEDVYVSFSQSLSESIDGLYIFNQIPQNDIQVTASVLIAPWTGSDTGSKYGDADYGTGEYGEGESGEGPTWTTASLRIYTGSYPNSVPTTLTTFLTESIYESAFIHTQSTGVPVTLSFSIPSQSIAIKDCLSMALHVSSGSSASESVENSLVVREYSLAFITPTQSGQGDGRVPTFIENAFSGTLGFSNTPDCQPLYNNIVGERTNGNIQIVEQSQISSGLYSSSLQPIQLPATGNVDYGGYVPSNFYQILSGSAQRSTVPESYYTTFRHTYPRYLGSRTTANGINTIDGLGGLNLLTREDGSEYGFGLLPVIDYQTAYFAYCDQVLDPYPVVNNVTQFNLKYLINDTGDALQPNLSPYTAYDVEGTWTEGGGGRVGINQVSGSSQYDQLNGLQPVKFVAKEPVAVLWSQTGATTYAGSDVSGSIPLAGAPGVVSTYTASFLSYNMTLQGRDNNSNNTNIKIVPLTTALSTSDVVGQFVFSTSSRYGQVDQSTTEQASSSFVSPVSPAPNGPSIGGTAGYAAVGEMYFNQDYFAINDSTANPPGYDYLTGNDLSDVYSFRAQFEFPTTIPQVYRTDAGGTWDKSDYNRTNVGNIYLKLQYTNASGTTNSGWIDMPMEQVTRPKLRGYFGNNQTIDIDLINTLGSSNAGLRSGNKQMYIQINPTAIRDAFANAGIDANNAQYASFLFELASTQNTTIRANRRYRWSYYQYYNNESVDAPRNFWNPANRAANLGGQATPFSAYSGPYITARVVSENGVSTAIDGALNAPYWAFSQSAGTDVRDHIQLQSPNGNTSYGGEYYQQYIPYTASENPQFPGGFEPIDTAIPAYNIPWTVQVGDEIKFQNSEINVYTVLNVLPPQDTADNKLVLTLDRAVPASLNKDFFILRRYRYSPNTVIINSLFPYGGLRTEQRFVEADNISTIFSASSTEVTSGFASSSISTTAQSGSYVTTVAPLQKKDNTPTGILFPEYPTALIELEPDKVITDLRDKKLIT